MKFRLRSVFIHGIVAAAWRGGFHIAIGVEDLWFDARAVQIGPSAANGWPPLRRFLVAVLLRRLVVELGPATRYVLHRNIPWV